MQRKELNGFQIKIIILVVLTIIVAVAIPLTIKIINNINASYNQDNNPPADDDGSNNDTPATPSLTVPESIIIDKLTTTEKFEYTVYDLGSYQVLISIENPLIASINSENCIIPNSVGSTNIITTINCEPAITKTTSLTIIDAVTEISHNVTNSDGSTCNTLFVGKTYNLIITENALVSNSPTIGYLDEYVTNFTLVSKQENVLTYSFKIIKQGDFSFYYNGKYCKEYINLKSYNMPTDINVNFSNVTLVDNTITLYLYKSSQENLANNDGYFKECEFSIIIPETTYDNVTFECFGNSIYITNNKKITAHAVGQSSITFYSSVSNISKTYYINVEEVPLLGIKLNNTQYQIGDTVNLAYSPDIAYAFEYSLLPSYALGDITVVTSLNLTFDNYTLTLTNNSSATAKIKFNNQVILTCNISPMPSYEIKLNVIQSSCTATLLENTLNITLGTQNFLILECLIFNTTTNESVTNKTIAVTINNTNIINSTSAPAEVKNGKISLNALSVGSTTITFECAELNVRYSLTVVVE